MIIRKTACRITVRRFLFNMQELVRWKLIASRIMNVASLRNQPAAWLWQSILLMNNV